MLIALKFIRSLIQTRIWKCVSVGKFGKAIYCAQHITVGSA